MCICESEREKERERERKRDLARMRENLITRITTREMKSGRKFRNLRIKITLFVNARGVPGLSDVARAPRIGMKERKRLP